MPLFHVGQRKYHRSPRDLETIAVNLQNSLKIFSLYCMYLQDRHSKEIHGCCRWNCCQRQHNFLPGWHTSVICHVFQPEYIVPSSSHSHFGVHPVVRRCYFWHMTTYILNMIWNIWHLILCTSVSTVSDICMELIEKKIKGFVIVFILFPRSL